MFSVSVLTQSYFYHSNVTPCLPVIFAKVIFFKVILTKVPLSNYNVTYQSRAVVTVRELKVCRLGKVVSEGSFKRATFSQEKVPSHLLLTEQPIAIYTAAVGKECITSRYYRECELYLDLSSNG